MLRTGTRRRTARLEITWRPNDLDHPRVAVVVPRFGRSVVLRNRLRRRLREHVRRTFMSQLPPLDFVIRSRAAAFEASRVELVGDLDRWFAQLPR